MTAQIGDLVEKIGKTEQSVQHRCGIGAMSPIIAAARAAKSKTAGGDKKDDKAAKEEETPLAKAVRDSSKVSVEASHGLIGALLKDSLFNGGRLAKEGGNADGFELPPVPS